MLSLGDGREAVLEVRIATDLYAVLSTFRSLSPHFRLDYCGIALLIMGSFVPWVYYGFYCHYEHKVIYLSVVMVLGIVSIVVSLWDKFSEPNLRPLRAGMSICVVFTVDSHCLTCFGLCLRRLRELRTVGRCAGHSLRHDGGMVHQNQSGQSRLADPYG